MYQPTGTIPPASGTWAPPSWPAPIPAEGPPQKKSRLGLWIFGGAMLMLVIAGIGAASVQNEVAASDSGSDVAVASSSRSGGSVADWANRNSSDMTALVSSLRAGESAARSGNVTRLVSSCSSLESAARIARSHLPVPAASVNAPYSAALDYFVDAAQACQNYDFEQSGTYLTLGAAKLREATAALKTYQ